MQEPRYVNAKVRAMLQESVGNQNIIYKPWAQFLVVRKRPGKGGAQLDEVFVLR